MELLGASLTFTDDLQWGLELFLTVLLAVKVWLVLRTGTPSGPSVVDPAAPQPNPTSGPSRPRAQLPILTAAALIERIDAQPLIERIRTNLAFSASNFDRDVLPVIHRFAEFVQLLPASQSHHHAQPGGLLQHTLEVAAFAAGLRNGYKLPPSAGAEAQMAMGATWSYGVVLAALLHDIGKPVSDVRVELFGSSTARPMSQWRAMAGPMQAVPGATHYVVSFPERSDYEAHQRLPIALLHAMVPASALQWISKDDTLLQSVVSYLDGTATVPGEGADAGVNVISEIVRKADSASVAENLRHGTRIRFSTARSTPLIERLMLGLRTLFSESLLTLNRPGAAGYVDPDGEHVWIVAGTCADQTRQLLVQRETHAEGTAAGLPSDNTRLFDTWAEYGALVQPPKEHGRGSVWWVRIDIGDWSQVLSVLKFPLDKIIPEDAKRPAPLAGQITPVEPAAKAVPEPVAEQLSQVSAEVGGEPFAGPVFGDLTIYDEAPVESGMPAAAVFESPASDATAAATPPPLEDVASAQLADDDTAGEQEVFLSEAESSSSASSASATPTRAVQPLRATAGTPRALYRMPGATARPNADKFVAWIQHGLGSGELSYNESDAMIHFVDDGMLLVSPRVFRTYLETNQYDGGIGGSKDEMRALQLEIQKAGYIARNPRDNSSFHYFQTQPAESAATRGADATKPARGGAVINCYLIPNPQAYVRPVPAPNPLLRRCDKPVRQDKPGRSNTPAERQS